MDPFERGLQQDIPLGEAASFFLKVKHGNAGPGAKQLAVVRDRLREVTKEKSSEGMGELPATGMGKNMPAVPMPQMPSAAMGQHKIGAAAKGPSRAQERAHEALETKYEKRDHTKNETRLGNLAGVTGALAGGFAGHHLGKHPTTAAAGALIGYASGKALGKDIGSGEDARQFRKHSASRFSEMVGPHVTKLVDHLPPKVVAAARAAVAQVASKPAATVADQATRAVGHGGRNAAIAGGALLATGAAGYGLHKHHKKHAHAMFKLALEEQGMAPASTGEDGEMPITDYLAAHQEGLAAEGDNQAAYLRQKLQEAQAQLQQTQQEAQMAQSTAQQAQAQQATHEQQMQAVQQQSQMATDAAMQNVQQAHELALKATSQALQAKDDAINTHQMAAQMRMAYQDMRGTIMDTVAQDNAAPIGEAIKAKGLESQVLPPGGEVPGGDEVGPDGQPAEEGPAEETADPNAPPGSPPPTGAEHGAQANGDGAPGGPEEPEPAGQVGIKAAGAWGDAAKHVGSVIRPRLPYMAAGAAMGAALPMIESHMGHDDLRKRVGDLQQKQDQGGGFGNALMLAQSKLRLAFGELSENHPGAASAMGGLVGGIAGGVQGPEIYRAAASIPGKIRELRK